MSTETWYVLETGEAADPREIVTGADGKLHHKDGRAVEYRPHGPRSRGVDPDEERGKAKPKPKPKTEDDKSAKAREAEAKGDRQMKAEDGKAAYKTR